VGTVGGITFTLPTPATSSGKVVNVKNSAATSSTISGSIDGATTTLTLFSGTSYQFHCNGTTWWLI
jgi:hypothetical protein